jgi:hypothetical protein
MFSELVKKYGEGEKYDQDCTSTILWHTSLTITQAVLFPTLNLQASDRISSPVARCQRHKAIRLGTGIAFLNFVSCLVLPGVLLTFRK